MDENVTEQGGPRLTHTQSVNRLTEIGSEMERLGGLDQPTREDDEYLAELEREFDEVNTHREHLERQARVARVRSVVDRDVSGATARLGRQVAGRTAVERGSGSADTMDLDPILEPDSVEQGRFRNPWDLSEVRTFGRSEESLTSEYRARAFSAIERMHGSTDRIRQAATKLVEQWDDEGGRLSRMVLASSEPTYMRAWSKLAAAGTRGLAANLDADERQAVDRVQSFARAMSLTDSAGGYLVPFQLDSTVILTGDGSYNQIRQLARTVIATGDTWNGVSSGDVSWSFDAESAEVSDDATTFAQPTVPVYLAEGFVPITRQAFQDAANVTTEVAKLLARGKDNLETSAFTTGSGSGQPTGIVTALVASSPTVIVNSASADTFAIGDVYALDSALPERYHGQERTGWCAHRLIWNKIRQFDTAGGAGLFAENLTRGIPEALLDERKVTSEGMDGTYGSGENYVLILGDWDNYVIADRIGMSVEFIPHLFSTSNNRPKNQHGWLAYSRVGADSVNDGAFRILDVT
jgi:HK97 family phage major capsid protein